MRREAAIRTLDAFHATQSPFDASRFETRALFYTSRDGTRVPLFVTMKKGAKIDGSHPTMLFGCGGCFNVATICPIKRIASASRQTPRPSGGPFAENLVVRMVRFRHGG